MLFAAVLLASPAFAADSPAQGANKGVKAGIDAWQRGDDAAAVAIWRPLANKGDADALFNLGPIGWGAVSSSTSWQHRACSNAPHGSATSTRRPASA